MVLSIYFESPAIDWDGEEITHHMCVCNIEVCEDDYSTGIDPKTGEYYLYLEKTPPYVYISRIKEISMSYCGIIDITTDSQTLIDNGTSGIRFFCGDGSMMLWEYITRNNCAFYGNIPEYKEAHRIDGTETETEEIPF